MFDTFGRGVGVALEQMARDPYNGFAWGAILGFFCALLFAGLVCVLTAFTKGLSKSYYDAPSPAPPQRRDA